MGFYSRVFLFRGGLSRGECLFKFIFLMCLGFRFWGFPRPFSVVDDGIFGRVADNTQKFLQLKIALGGGSGGMLVLN